MPKKLNKNQRFVKLSIHSVKAKTIRCIRYSGGYQGKRFIQGGGATLRRMLYMATLASVRWNPSLKAFYKRLRAAGKPAKVALVAVIRKLVSVINSVIKRKSIWQLDYVVKQRSL